MCIFFSSFTVRQASGNAVIFHQIRAAHLSETHAASWQQKLAAN
jgi:hypothetical protein